MNIDVDTRNVARKLEKQLPKHVVRELFRTGCLLQVMLLCTNDNDCYEKEKCAIH